MKIKRTHIWRGIYLTLALLVGYLGYSYWSQRVDWPNFPAPDSAHPDAPLVVAHVPRDFGWRTGDPVPVELFIKQQPGTEVDRTNIAITGDFEIRTQPQNFIQRRLNDGSELIQVQFVVQSFNVSKSWTLNAKMTYKVLKTKDVQDVSLPALVVSTSMTYDGRPAIQPGPLAVQVSFWDQVCTFGLIIVGVGCIAAGLWWQWRLKRARANAPAVMSPTVKVKHNVDVIWARINAGDLSVANYVELERNVRWLFKLQAQTRGQIEMYVEMTRHPYEHEITTIIALCDKRIYDHEYLTESEHKAVYDAFARIIAQQPFSLQQPPALPGTPAASLVSSAEAAIAEELGTDAKAEALSEAAPAATDVPAGDAPASADVQSVTAPGVVADSGAPVDSDKAAPPDSKQ